MIFNLDLIDGIYMAVGPIDLRKGIDGYSALVTSVIQLEPFEKTYIYSAIVVKIKLRFYIGMVMAFGFSIKDLNQGSLSG